MRPHQSVMVQTVIFASDGVALMLGQLISRKTLLKFCVLFKPMMETGQH